MNNFFVDIVIISRITESVSKYNKFDFGVDILQWVKCSVTIFLKVQSYMFSLTNLSLNYLDHIVM